MNKLWAPWRSGYIAGIDKKRGPRCVFCSLPRDRRHDKKNLILFRGKSLFVIMNRFPYNNGHLMVVPYRHVASIEMLKDQEHLEMMQLLCRCKKALARALKPHGFNIGMNLGRVAGAGIDKHVHAHILPRWNGDTNYLPTLAETKVISVSLAECYRQIIGYF